MSAASQGSPRNDRFFVTGGTLPANASCYVARQADDDLLRKLLDGEICCVLDPRQMGKSSLMVRAAARLRERGVSVVILDLTSIGRPSSPEQWYYGLLLDLGVQLDLVQPLKETWAAHRADIGPFQRWLLAIRQVVLERSNGRIVVFVDEIDVVRSLPFDTDEFFAGIRGCYNQRATDSVSARIGFCLLGVASPSDLIRNPQAAPFNVGKRIDLADFSESEAAPLAEGLAGGSNADAGSILKRVLYWTGGHPYLTQRLCRSLAEVFETDGLRVEAPHQVVDRLCSELFLSAEAKETDDNLAFVALRITHNERDVTALLSLYLRVWKGGRVRDDPTDPMTSELKLSGIVRVDSGYLTVRNRIYAEGFDRGWVKESMPGAEVRRQHDAFRRGLVRASMIYGSIALLISGLAWSTYRQKLAADAYAASALSESGRANQEAFNARRQLYFAEMGLAQRAWDQGQVHRLRSILGEARSNAEVGWEWRYWDRLCHLELLSIPTGRSGLEVGLSPDGRTIAVPALGGLDIVDPTNGKVIRSLRSGRAGDMRMAAFSPDGQWITSGSLDGSIVIWDLSKGEPTSYLPASGPLLSLRYSTSGQILVAVSADGTVRLWKRSGTKPAFTTSSRERLTAAALSPDDRRLVSGGADNVIRELDVASGRTIAEWTGGESSITSISFSPDGNHIAASSADGFERLWGSRSHRLVAKIDYGGPIWRSAFSPDGTRLLTVGQGGTVKVWSTKTGALGLTLRMDPSPSVFAGFTGDGKRIVTVGDEASIKVWDALRSREAVSFRAQRDFVVGLAFSPDCKRVTTVGADRFARVWDVSTGRQLRVLPGHTGQIYSVAYSPDGSLIATGGDDSTIRIWDANSAKPLRVLNGRAGRVNCIAWSSRGRYIASAYQGGVAKLWDTVSGRELATLAGHSLHCLAVAFRPDGREIATVGVEAPSADGSVKLWDLAGKGILTVRSRFPWLWSVCFSPDGKQLLLGCQDDTAKVLDAQTGRVLRELQGHANNVHSAVFTPDGKRIVSGSHDRSVRVWDAVTGNETLSLTRSHDVYSVACSPDGHLIAATGLDGQVSIWRDR